MNSCTIENSVSKTTIDSLYAKWSVVAAGYDPICAKNNGKIYSKLLISVSEASVNYKDSIRDKKKSDASESFPTSKQSEVRVRRQIPLVNMGYSLMIKAISDTIARFIQYHSMVENIPLQSLTCRSKSEFGNISTLKK